MLNNTSGELQVTITPCGELNDEPLYLISLASGELVVNLTNLGGAIIAIWTPDKDGKKQNIVAGYTNIIDYTDNPHYFGCLLGRNAGRISDSKFELDGDVVFLSRNDGRNHLHGGIEGFNKKVWKIKSFIQEESEAGVILEYLSEDGDEGYPGNLWVTVKYSVNSQNQLKIEYDAVTDKSTPVNLSNHTYFNLSGFETPDILGHKLWVNAGRFTEVDDKNIPTGKSVEVKGTPLDFSISTEIGARIEEAGGGEGYNHNFVLNDQVDGTTRLSAILSDPSSGRSVKVYTDRPGMQVYTANDWSGNIIGAQGFAYQRHGAIALETQAFPDSPNRPEFPDTILRPGQRYLAETIYEFTCQ